MSLAITSPLQNDTAFRTFVENLPQNFSDGGITLHNARNVIKQFTVTLDNGTNMDVVVKRYRKPNPVQRFVYGMFRKGKAERAYTNSQELLRRGISTPKGYAYLEIRKGRQLTDSFFVSGVDNAPPIAERLNTPEQFDTTMATDFAAFAWTLHRKGILHHDLNSTNVLYHRQEDGHYTFSVIDINRVDFLAPDTIPPTAECLENLTRYTGRMDLYRFVATHYAMLREWDINEGVQKIMDVKAKHDKQWRRRKSILKPFKRKK